MDPTRSDGQRLRTSRARTRPSMLGRMRASRVLLPIALLSAASLSASASCGGGDDTGGSGGGASVTSTSTASSSSTGTPLPDVFTVTGVVTDGTAPLPNAIVMQGGGDPSFRTGPDGTFSIELTKALPGVPTVVAAKEGYRSTGEEFVFLPATPITLVLREVAPPDNDLGYQFSDPGVGDAVKDNSTALCGHCHTTFVAQFQESAHAEATRSPFVQDLYAGVASAITADASCTQAGGVVRTGTTPGAPGTAASRCYVGHGVLSDLNTCGAKACDDPSLMGNAAPTKFGHCADCHAAGLDGPTGGRNLLEATGTSFDDGNHCDACHHIRDVDLTSKAPGVSGRLLMQRPREHKSSQIGSPLLQAMFGPDPDVPNPFMGGVYQPKFRSSEFCAGCHEYEQEALLPGATVDAQKWPGGLLPTLSTYSEWKGSSFDTPGTQCQFCHMPKVSGLYNSVDVTTPDAYDIAFGFGRSSDQLRSHIFRDPLQGTPRLIDGTLVGDVALAQAGAELDAVVSVKNVGSGHAAPTGDPMRALVLAVRAEGCGQTFSATSGMTIPDTGGALASGVVGTDVSVAASVLTWPVGASRAKVGDTVRVVRPTGQWDDYSGVGHFASASLTPQEKGIEIFDPVGEATIVSIVGDAVTLSAPLAAQAGDVVYVGSAAPSAFADGDPTRALAGAPGHVFSRVMVDPSGARNPPHYRANDIASDNRLMPDVEALTHHAFAIPNGCTMATVTMTVLYRPLPFELSRERAWDARDYVVLETQSSIALQ